MKKEQLFIYRISNTYDLYKLLKIKYFGEFYILTYQDIIDDEDLDSRIEVPNEEEIEYYITASTKEQFKNFISRFYWTLFLMDEKKVLYCISNEKIDTDIYMLNENETDMFLDKLIDNLQFEQRCEEDRKYLIEHKEEMIKEYKEYEEYWENMNK